MKTMNFEQMERIQGGSWGCALSVIGLATAGAAVIMTGGALTPAFAWAFANYAWAAYDTSSSCFK